MFTTTPFLTKCANGLGRNMRQSALRIALFIALWCLWTSVVAAASEPTSRVETGINPTDIISLTNAVRSERGLATLTADTLVMQAAQSKAEQMAKRSEFLHTLSDGTTGWGALLAAGYHFRAAGENLAMYFTRSSDVIQGWMNSRLHRANILSDTYEDIGVGIAPGTYQGYRGYYIVQLFATPLATK